MAMVSPRMIPSARRVAATAMSESVCGSGIKARTVGSRKLATSSTSTPRPARMRASNSGTSSWRCAIASARDCPRSSSRSRQVRSQAERSTPRKRRRVEAGSAVRAIVMACPRPYRSGRDSVSKQLAILDEAGALRQGVVELARDGVGLVGEPIDPARTLGPRPLLDRRDQRPSEPQLARLLGDEQVLEIAIVADGPARAMKEVVHDAAQLAIHIGAEHAHRLRRIVQARPGHGRGLVRNDDLVERLIALPQRLPGGALIDADGADHDVEGRHRVELTQSKWNLPSCR